MKKNNIKESNYELTDKEIKNIAGKQFKSLTENIAERNKKFIVVGGQSGSGKSKLVKYKLKALYFERIRKTKEKRRKKNIKDKNEMEIDI